jgi:hypothetical protein
MHPKIQNKCFRGLSIILSISYFYAHYSHIIYTMGKKRANSDILDGTKKKKKEPLQDGLTAQASAESPSQRCWKCRGRGKKYQKSTQAHDGTACKVCEGEGIRKKSQRSQDLASKPGQILKLRGYPEDHPLRQIFPRGFSGPSSWWGRLRRRRDNRKCSQDDEKSFDYLQTNLRPYNGELVGSLGCGDWRIYQIADGNKLTVDDFVCAWVAAEEMRKRGYGSHLHRDNAMIGVDGKRMFGGRDNEEKPSISDDGTANNRLFNHADIGTGCGSVLMMTAWAFLGEINSVGIEAQKVSFDCLRRGLEWNVSKTISIDCDSILTDQNFVLVPSFVEITYGNSHIANLIRIVLTTHRNFDPSYEQLLFFLVCSLKIDGTFAFIFRLEVMEHIPTM